MWLSRCLVMPPVRCGFLNIAHLVVLVSPPGRAQEPWTLPGPHSLRGTKVAQQFERLFSSKGYLHKWKGETHFRKHMRASCSENSFWAMCKILNRCSMPLAFLQCLLLPIIAEQNQGKTSAVRHTFSACSYRSYSDCLLFALDETWKSQMCRNWLFDLCMYCRLYK